MASTEWLRTFLAVYRAGSVSEAARQRSLSQPAASQQLGALERSVGSPLFVRSPRGMEPTEKGRELYAEVAESLGRLEHVLRGLDAGDLRRPLPAVRFGSTAEYFSVEVLPRLGRVNMPVTARFGTDDELFELLAKGELDVIVTSTTPPRRQILSTALGVKRFVLVASPSLQSGRRFRSLGELGQWLVGKPWVSYSLELPLTRRFWLTLLDRPFAAELRLVAPDLRAVVSAVELGLGMSLLPSFVCADALASGRVLELHPVSELAPTEPWFACHRSADAADPQITALLSALGGAAE